MSFRKVLLVGTLALVFSVGSGCESGSDKPPKADTTPGAPSLKMQKPGGAPGPGAPAPKPQ